MDQPGKVGTAVWVHIVDVFEVWICLHLSTRRPRGLVGNHEHLLVRKS